MEPRPRRIFMPGHVPLHHTPMHEDGPEPEGSDAPLFLLIPLACERIIGARSSRPEGQPLEGRAICMAGSMIGERRTAKGGPRI